MNRKIVVLLILILVISLSACGLILPTATTKPRPTTTAAPATTATTVSLSGTTTHGVTTSAGQTTTAGVTTTLETTLAEPFIPSGYALLQDEIAVGIPATGDVNLLVFVIDFPDAPLSSSGISLSEITAAFNGDADDTAYESLQSYYDESSFDKLHLTADVFTYTASETTYYYEQDYIEYYTDSDLIYEMMTYYDDTIDYTRYDANHDGYVDGVYVVYTAPVSYYEGSDLWWAYQDYYVYADEDFFDGVTPFYFCWSGTDFLLEDETGVDAHTIIHETGHMLGLDDYYDYDDTDSANSGGLGGADMMDNTVGDQSPISKLLLGWITPLVVTESMTVDLAAYAETGQTILLIDEWNDTIFDEYLLITYYTPTGLYAYDKEWIFTIPGILIYHVDARIGEGYDETSAYWTIFNYNNTDTPHKFVAIIEADQDGKIDSMSLAEDEDLFQPGDVFRGTIAPEYDWYQWLMSMDFTVAVDALGTVATLTFTFE